MPSAIQQEPKNGITKFTNCRLVRGDSLVWDDIWVSSKTGKITRSQTAFYDGLILPDETIDLGGRIVAPGMIECQLNGAFGFNFSTVLDDMSQYGKKVRDLNKKLVQTGVTSYIPTVTSQTSDLYKQVGGAGTKPPSPFPLRVNHADFCRRSCPISALQVTCKSRRMEPSL